MALKTPEQYIQSVADLDLEIYIFGEKVDDYTDHPIIRPSLNCMAMTYELAAAARIRRPHAGDQPPHREEGQPLHAHPPDHRGPGQEGQDAAPARPEDGLLLPALRRHGRHQRPLLHHLRHRQGQGHRLPPALQKYVQLPAGERPGGRRRHDRSQGRPQPGAARSRPTRTCTCTSWSGARTASSCAAPRPTRRAPATPTRSSSCRPWPCARATRTTPSASARPADAAGICYIYGRQSCDTRKLEDNDLDVGNTQVRRPGSADGLRRRLRALGTRLHVRRDRVRRRAGGALRRLPPPELRRLQGGRGRRAHRRRGAGRRIQRRCQGLPHQGQADRDDPPERDAVLLRRRLLLRGPEDAGRQLPDRPAAGQRLQAERDPVPLRDRPPGRGHRRRPDGHHAVGAGPRAARRSARSSRSTWSAPCDVPAHRPHARPAPDREPHPRHRRGRLPHRVDARRRLAAGPAHHDRPPGQPGAQEGPGQGARRRRQAAGPQPRCRPARGREPARRPDAAREPTTGPDLWTSTPRRTDPKKSRASAAGCNPVIDRVGGGRRSCSRRARCAALDATVYVSRLRPRLRVQASG